ncbi:MAG: hypothetical protein UT84_C0016G0004 [Candidatus Curtissbacteria bacterium GW2011_GWA1_40_16]|uniref:Uncharacterized protein n=1 Tax=Candidatus Curtissbacteria bacterium GW2011_GWA1_40_16 TaxID=1618405 RepID=A0A0G0TSE2_9BACT|nr:MAG: hypothetical protein UT84_C0016G0004 [Candidatus Curtissbacteria bacterium GW2011_GWA1_40_16]
MLKLGEFMFDDKLDNQEIKKRILNNKYPSGFRPSEDLVKSILDQFWFHDFYNSFIADEVYLGWLLEYLDKERPKTFSRYNFYHYFFDRIAKRKLDSLVLQAVALAFEKMQTDAVNPQELKKILKEVGAPTRFQLSFLTWVKKNHLAGIKEREQQTLFIWNHHTLTEFLVAEYLLGQKKSIEEFERLAILNQEGVVAFKSSWSGVLRFLLESSSGKAILKWLIHFLEENKDNIDDNLVELLVLTNANLTREFKDRIFKLVYSSYFERLVWLPAWARNSLFKFVDTNSYKKIKGDIKRWPDQTETFVKRGNVVAVVEGLLEYNSPLVQKDKSFWEKKLIDFVNNPRDDGNGVLPRNSLSALAKLKKPTIIPLVASCIDSNDSLVRDTFIEFCIETDPSSQDSISHFIKGIKRGSGIYARHGLFKITKKESMKYLLEEISEDEEFWKSFLKHASIYDKKDGDQQLIENIEKELDEEIIGLLKKIIFKIFQTQDIYQEEKSGFIKQIVLLINNRDKNFLFEILDETKKLEDDTKSLHLFFDYEEILAALLTPDNLAAYFEKIKELPGNIQKRADSIIYIAERINGEVGQAVYEKAVDLKKVKPVDQQVADAYWEEQQSKKKQNTIQDFRKLLEPAPGKYIPSVFEYYLNNKRELDEFFKTKEGARHKKRLTKLAVDEGIRKIKPQEIKITIPEKGVGQFTWSAVAAYYGKVLSVVKIFAPQEIKNHRQQIIDFIPYAYSEDMSLIMDLVEKIKDEELGFVNKVMSDKRDDRRYLIPGTYIYLVGHYAKKGCKLSGVKPVLRSFVGGKYIQDQDQKSALETLALFTDVSDIETKKFLNIVFKEEIGDQKTKLAETANAILITVFKDEKAIDWRIGRIKGPLVTPPRDEEVIAYTPTDAEVEVDWMYFAKPLIELKDEKYLDKFFELLDYSFKILKEKKTEKEKKEYWGYINYLWRIAISFAENLKEKRSFKPLLRLEKWALKHSGYENSNWLSARIYKLRGEYINTIGVIREI